MIKVATGLRLGTAETETILRRFTRNGVQHPTYKALLELGRAYKTIFLQISLVYIQTLLLQQLLADPAWMNKMTKEDLRALTPLIYGNVNPYGTIRLDMTERLAIEKAG
jgi:TnpA family transposase